MTAYFARRCTEPQVVADLVSETFVEAAGSFGTIDPSRGSARGWLIAIARRVFARWCEAPAGDRLAIERLGGRLVLDADETDELMERIDAQHHGRVLLEQCAFLPALEREAVELVDLTGLAPREAASALGVSAGTLRVRLHRARARLRKGGVRRARLRIGCGSTWLSSTRPTSSPHSGRERRLVGGCRGLGARRW